ncbi:MAG TPA: hypothetical protein LFW20_05100 [Rickettsia endosymbiont of Omalisus fontisbellaquei]|nr:hypothetical protein [Rickettsia endosymbiont of Omalisus fontisbellaquei]
MEKSKESTRRGTERIIIREYPRSCMMT